MEALEVWHPKHSGTRSAAYERFAREHGLVVTGGSDSHGGNTGLPNLSGCWAPETSVRALRERAEGKKPAS